MTQIWSIATKCSGKFCDRQNSTKLLTTGKACGCYSMNSRIANAVMVHNIDIEDMNRRLLFQTTEFSSINFMNLYMKNALSRNIPANYFDDYEKMIKLKDAVETIVCHINRNNGFTVIGWYKRGEIEDKGNEEKEHVEASNLMIHPVSIYPYHQPIVYTQYILDNLFDFNSEI